MTANQPAAPAAPPAPATGTSLLSAQDRAEIAQSVRDAQATARDAQRAVVQAQREAARAAGGNTSVTRDNAGGVVVTGPDGRTITIPANSGLDRDQIQQMVQTALQPTAPPRREQIPSAAVPVVAIVFTFLFLIAVVISRAISGRRAAFGPPTAALPPEAAARLARIEQAVEAVAIEVERISEAQRYSAQLLTDRLRETVPAIPGTRAEARPGE